VNAGAGVGLTGYVQTNLQPGVITDLRWALCRGDLKAWGCSSHQPAHQAEACGRPVTIRSFAYLRISTDVEPSEFAIYGNRIQI
jgi:hypothetical protein